MKVGVEERGWTFAEFKMLCKFLDSGGKCFD